MGGFGFAGNQVSDFDELASAMGVALQTHFGGSGPKSLLQQSIGMDPDTIILTSQEAVLPEGISPEEARVRGSAEVATVTDLTVGDVFNTYYDMTDAEQREYQERLYGAGMYTTSTKPEDIHREDRTIVAIKNAIEREGNRGRNPLHIQAPADFEMPEPEEPVSREYSDAQLRIYADTAAKTVFGRGATTGEKQLAIETWRAMQDTTAGAPTADMAEALRRRGLPEARKHALGDTLRSFTNIVASR
jgi:hypothetical protein